MALLQNIWIQIAIGVLPAALVALILLFSKKMFKMSYITLTLATVAIVVCGALAGFAPEETVEPGYQSTYKTAITASEKDLTQMAYSFLRNNDYESAQRIMDLYAENYGYDSTCTLINGRSCALKGRYSAALASYKKAGNTAATEQEIAALEKIVFSERNDAGGGEEITQLAGLGGMQELVYAAIDKELYNTALKEAVLWISSINKLYNQYLQYGYTDEDQLPSLLKSMELFESNEILKQLDLFREARTKLLLLKGNFKAIIAYMDEYASCAEYMTVLELCLCGKANGAAIANTLGLQSIDGLDKLIERLESIWEKGQENLPHEDLVKLEDQITMLKSYNTDMGLYAIEDRLQKEAADDANYKYASKIYMALSKLSALRKDAQRRNRYFSDALVTAPASRDGDYADAMGNLSDVISGNGDDSLIKDIPQNAADAIEHSYYIPGTGELIRNDQVEEEMTANVQDSTIKFSAAITINRVDPSNFEEVVLRVQVSDEMISERELKNLILLTDCNYNIDSFEIKKVEFKKSNIILVCDNSGSMGGSIDSLQNAVRKFLETSNEKETIGFYTFDDTILQSLPLGTATPANLEAAIDKMSDQGGTNIYGTLTQILGEVHDVPDASQVIILMTDGEDNNPASIDEINNYIGGASSDKGYVVYVLGMGSNIKYDYLSAIAQAGGGRCIYSPSDAELESLYQFIHGTVQNQYEITFTAKDTLTAQNRRVVVALDQQDVQASKTYNVGNEDAENATVDFDEGVAVYGLSNRLVFRDKDNVDIYINGTGFESNDHMYLNFYGERTYGATTEYVSSTQFRVNLPENMEEGLYDMEVHLSGRQALYPEELTVVEGEPDEIIFGGYRFTAYKIQETDSGYTLSSYVTMNDWLHFNGTITLTGSLDDAQIKLTDNSGCYVDYSGISDTVGFAAELKKKGIPLEIPALGTMTIYNAVAYGDQYPTDPHDIPLMELLDLLMLDHPILRLYPNQMKFEVERGSSKLPMQDFFMSSINDEISLFDLDLNATGTINRNRVSLKAKAALTYVDADTPVEALVIDFLDMRSSVQKDMVAFEIDTETSFYKMGFNVKIPVFDAWVGASWWFENGGFDGFELRCDKDVTVNIYSVPLTFSDFKLGMDNFTKQTVTVSPSDTYLGDLTGAYSVSAYKVSAIIPPLKSYVGDLSLISAEGTFSTTLGNKFIYNLQGKSTMKLLNLIDISEIEMKVGQFTHTDALLGMDEESVTGFVYSKQEGFKADIHNFYLEIFGGYEIDIITKRFMGVRYQGKAEIGVDWWIFDPHYSTDGAVTCGFFRDNNNLLQFTLRASWNENGKRKGILAYIREDGQKEFDSKAKF